VIVFYKVTCPVCQMAAPKIDRLAEIAPGRVVAVGQDPEDRLEAFREEFGIRVPTHPDTAPYPVSEAYGVEVVPTLFLVDRGEIVDRVESWDRAGFNRIARSLAERAGAEYVPVSEEGDGLPDFRPG
jgi:thiol-disulfide isomerase/thioredoxin